MAFYQFKVTQIIPATKSSVWDYISTPVNLQKITPGYMNFEITSDVPEKMHAGLIISYRVSPLPFYRTSWLTEITHIHAEDYFVDEQRMGPYRLWHHQHHLKEIEGGTEMTDIVTYIPPFGFLGAIANTLFIKTQLQKIFDYRKTALEKHFGIWA